MRSAAPARRGKWVLSLLFITLLAAMLAPGQVAGAAGQMPAPEAWQLTLQSIDEVLAGVDPKILKNVRGVGAGSFMSGKVDALSDIDLTMGHPDPKVEKALVEKINARIKHNLKGRKADINVIYSRNKKFQDMFRGETGQAFFKDYANKTGQGRGCFRWDAKKVKGGGTKVAMSRQPSEQFWPGGHRAGGHDWPADPEQRCQADPAPDLHF